MAFYAALLRIVVALLDELFSARLILGRHSASIAPSGLQSGPKLSAWGRRSRGFALNPWTWWAN
jgi:hypothetical protein